MINWKISYYGRLVVEKLMCITRTYFIQELFKKTINRHSAVDEFFVINRIDKKLRELEPIIASLNIKVIYEQGTGWHGVDLLVFYLLGCKVFTSDVRGLLKGELVIKSMRILVENRHKFSKYEKKINRMEGFFDLTIEQLLNKIDVNYYVNDDFNKIIFPHSVGQGLYYSDSVLQRMKNKDLIAYINNSKKMLPECCYHLHVIDSKDFFSIGKETVVPPLYYLKINSLLWDFLTCKKLNYQNRLRVSEFKKIFEKNGFVVDVSNVNTLPDCLEYVTKTPITISGMDSEDIAVTNFTLLAKNYCI
ncbi:MAG: hypothetical protein QM500_17690 [Methylococcales bacterium]